MAYYAVQYISALDGHIVNEESKHTLPLHIAKKEVELVNDWYKMSYGLVYAGEKMYQYINGLWVETTIRSIQ